MKLPATEFHFVADALDRGQTVSLLRCNRCRQTTWVAVPYDMPCPRCGQGDVEHRRPVAVLDPGAVVEVEPSSPTYLEWDDLDIRYRDGVVVIYIPDRETPVTIALETDEWNLDHNKAYIRNMLLRDGYLIVPHEFVGYGRHAYAMSGEWLWLHLLTYDDIPVHPMTEDPAVFLRVCLQAPGSMKQVEVTEVQTQLGVHEHRLAYKLLDRIADELELGQREVSAEALLPVEGMSPDAVAELVSREEVT